MENRSVSQKDICAIPEMALAEADRELQLTEAELHSLVQFFELLDRWDREVVQ